MYKVVDEVKKVDDVKAPLLEGANAKASQEGTFDDANRNKTVAVDIAALSTVLVLLLVLVLVEKDFIM